MYKCSFDQPLIQSPQTEGVIMRKIPDIYLDDNYALVIKDGLTIEDLLPKEVAALANEHWLNFPPSHPFINDLVAIIFFFLSFVNFFGNGIVIYVFLKDATLRRPSNMLIINLAVSDFLMLFTNGLPLTINMFYNNYWIFGKLGCKIYAAAGGVTGLCSLWTMVFIGYDRYNVIVGGFTATPVSKMKAFLFISFCWGYATCILIWPFLEIWGKFSLEGLLVSCSFEYLEDTWNQRTYTIFIFTCCFIVPMSFIIYFYSFIVKAVWGHEAAMKAQAKKMNVESLRNDANSNEESAEMKIAKVAVTNVLLWICAWTPYASIVLIGQFGSRSLLTPLVSQMPSMLAKTCSCFNPIVYAISHPKFREALQKHLPGLGIGDKVDKSDDKSKVTTAA